MRGAFRWLSASIFALVVVQIGLAAVGAFDAIHKAEKASVGKKSVEDAFGAHAILGSLIVLLMLLLLLAAVAGGLGPGRVRFAGIVFGLGILQYVLGVVSPSVPALGFLHGINAVAIAVATGLLAHRTAREARAGAAPGPAASAA